MGKPHFDIAPSPDYPVQYGILLACLQDGTREWREELGEVDPEVICWQPYPKGYSIGGILLHIAEVEAYWVEEFSLDREIPAEEKKQCMSAEIDQYGGSWPTPPKEPLSYYYDLLDRIRVRTLDSIKAFPTPDTVKEREWETTTLRWVLGHVLQHEAYHGGQAVMLKEIACKMHS